MSEMKSGCRLAALLRAGGLVLAGMVAGSACAAPAAPAAASMPAQVPLVSRVVNPPPPNVVIDIDDSGSMQAHYMPEGTVRIDTGTVTYAAPYLPKILQMTDLVDVFVNDQINRIFRQPGIPKGTSWAITGSTNVFQRQMRSSDINSIFYNPAVLYLPWLEADGVTRMAPGDYKAAYWNLADPTIAKPTTDLSAVQNITSNWCDTSTSAGSTCSSNTSQSYNPGLFYVLANDGKTPPTYTADPNSVFSYTEYDLNGTATNFPAAAARVCAPAAGSPCCASTAGCTLDQERQNFANWFVYYRSRTHLVKGSLSETLPGTVGKIRAAWGTINTTGQTIDGRTTDVLRTGIRDLDVAQLATIMSGYQSINPSGSTPLRKATVSVGEYFKWSGSSSPWNKTPGTSDGSPASCRRSYHLLMTDGYYNDKPPAIGNVDGTPGKPQSPNPLNYPVTSYVPANPYQDNNANLLADYAMSYFVADLQGDIDNRVLANDAAGGDIAYWQHLSMFTVGLGVQGTLNWNIDPAKSDLAALTAGTKTWGTDQIDDLWHAAVDTHGTYFSAKDSTTLSSALKTALGSAGAETNNDSGAATSSTSLQTNTFAYIPEYRSVQWTGNISAYPIDNATGQRAATAIWTATSKLPAFDARKIYTWNGSASTLFNPGMDAALKNLVDPSTATQDLLINYIRGDSSHESTVGYRQRVRVAGEAGTLGDFLDSAPTFVQNFVNLGYDKPTSPPGYSDFIARKNARSSGTLFEGANDGMLHAFDGTTGIETWAYIPKVLLPNLVTLSQQDYGVGTNVHRDYVDGPLVETDAYIATKRAPLGWANLVMGTFGAGARGFYAIDTTSLPTLDEKSLLWEVTNANDPDIGYMFNPPATGVLANGSWKAFVGNGVDSDSGSAVLLIVDLASGAIDKLALGAGPNNGLTGVKLLIDDQTEEVVAAYAGDLKGNVYRVDFTAAGAPVVSFGGAPLFSAVGPTGIAQPVTAPPNVYKGPTGGNIVLVGTGRLIDVADADTTTTQSFYGILDPTPAGTSAVGTVSPAATRAELVQQVITPSTAPVGFFAVSSNTVEYPRQKGWFIDLGVVSATQRVIYPSTLIGDFVLINTTQPAPLSADPCMQAAGSSTYFLLPAFDGAAYTKAPVWDVDGNGTIDPGSDNSTGDTIQTADGTTQAAGYSSSGAGQTSIVLIPPAGSSPTGPNNTFVNVGPGGDVVGNTYCLFNCGLTIQKRVWQQLMTPPF